MSVSEKYDECDLTGSRPSPSVTTVDLNGTWHPQSAEGYDDMLKTIGYGAIQIKGALLCKETITQTNSSLEIVTSVKVIFITIASTSTYRFGVSAEEKDPKGNVWQSDMYYSGDCLVISGICEKKGYKNVQRRQIIGDEMIVTYEFTHPGGTITALRRLKKHH
ncbi:uncharacterized protein LOC135489624 [Lineus longissimus]|uniref:uncharacterized protein LOC135489624 n=1 Tax=Lineus longissimus TaxID=88925 RepID=UPI002B4D8562